MHAPAQDLGSRPARPSRRGPAAALRASLLALPAVCLCACSATVEVARDFPPPLIEPLALRMGLVFTPALSAYEYREVQAADRDWTVRLGAAQVRMFRTVFGGLFREVREAADVPAAVQESPAFDGILVPAVDAFEFSLPNQAANDQYAVWIRYNLDVHGPDGALLMRWPVTGYGQSGTGGFSDVESMERAVVLAMRDAAATIAVNFARQPAIREKLLHDPAPGQP